MKAVNYIDTSIEALEKVSNNARQKYNTSRSAIRIHELSVDLSKAWQKYKINLDLFVHKETGRRIKKWLVLFVIKNSSNGLKLKSIVRRTGLPVDKVKDILKDLNELNVISTIRNKYQLKK